MNELKVFTYENSEIRTVQKEGEPWWVLRDVCDVLEIGNPSMVADRLDDDEKGISRIDTLGGKQSMAVVNESGLYNVILRSDKPEAKKFKRWVTHEVIPSIRKNGEYVTPKKAQQKLGETNAAARIIRQTLKEAGMAPQFVAVAMRSLYAPVGVEIPLEGITVNNKTYDATSIAKRLGVMSRSGNPHGQAVSAIISMMDIKDSEKVLVPFQSTASGHTDTNWQYTDSVIGKVSLWLDRNGYPAEITARGKSYKIQYLRKTA